VATRRVNDPNSGSAPRRPATTPEARERQLIAQAVDLASRQLADGTASAQVITHYLKLGSSREQLEQQRLAEEVGLLRVKAEAMESAKRVEELYGQALNAMRQYGGHDPIEPPEMDFDD
jgi:uncharacterized protein YcaQ